MWPGIPSRSIRRSLPLSFRSSAMSLRSLYCYGQGKRFTAKNASGFSGMLLWKHEGMHAWTVLTLFLSISVLRRIVSPSLFSPVFFCDVILADILTSFSNVFGDLFATGCNALGGASNNTDGNACHRDIFVPLLIRYVLAHRSFVLQSHMKKKVSLILYACDNAFLNTSNPVARPSAISSTPSNTRRLFLSSSSRPPKRKRTDTSQQPAPCQAHGGSMTRTCFGSG